MSKRNENWWHFREI